LRPERVDDNNRAIKARSRANFLIISAYTISKVIVGELLEHRVAKRSAFVGVAKSEPVYFTLYSFTLIGLLTDAMFEAFSEMIYADNAMDSEAELRARLFTQLLPKDVSLKRGFGYA